MKLKTRNEIEIEKPIILPPSPKIETFPFINERHRLLLEDFYTMLTKEAKEEYLSSFYQNITSLIIEEKRGFINTLITLFTVGSYDFYDNKISIYPFQERCCDIIKHELLHMATRKKDKDKCHVGFLQVQKDLHIGNTLNEGYTEIMCKRLQDDYQISPSYKYPLIIAQIIETIVGKEKMKELYFTGDLYELTNILTKYNTRSNVKDFLIDTDYILSPLYRKELSNKVIDINNFIYETFTNWLIKESIDKPLLEEYKSFIELITQILEIYNKDIINKNIKYNTEAGKTKIKILSK